MEASSTNIDLHSDPMLIGVRTEYGVMPEIVELHGLFAAVITETAVQGQAELGELVINDSA